MTTFDNTFADLAVPSLFRQFGEEIQYLPRDGAPRTVTAIILREPLQALEPIDDGVAPALTVKVLNKRIDAEWGGIPVDQLDTGGDKVYLSWRKGEEPAEFSITKLIGVKGGMTVFEVR